MNDTSANSAVGAPVLLRLVGLRLAFEGRSVLDGLDLQLARGEIHALLGTNGSGKSSLAFTVMGCEGYRCSAGEIWFDGQRIDALPLHERARLGITLAWQEPARFEGLRIADYLRVGCAQADVDDCLRRVGLDPHEYATRPIDRRLSGIDVLSLDTLIDVIEALRDAGSTVLLITHQTEVAVHADRASQLCGGRIVFEGDTAAVLDHYRQRTCTRCDGTTCHD